MRAAVLREYGVPRWEVFDDPVATGDRIVVEVCAAGVNPFDVMSSSGNFYVKPTLPCVVGLDGVARVGNGRRLYFEGTVAPFGAVAERTLVEPHDIVEVPDDMDDAVAAALGNAGLAAWLSLTWRAKLLAGETVLVLGATGTAGRIAVQVARLLGADRVIAAGRDPVRLRRAAELGADACVSLSEKDALRALREATAWGADVIVDLLWGDLAAIAVHAAAVGARFVQVGHAAGVNATIPADVVRSKALRLLGYANYHVPREERHMAYRRLAEHAVAGRVSVDVDRLAFEDVGAAWKRQLDGASSKLVLVPRGS